MAEDVFVRKPACLESFYMDLNDCGFNMTFHYYLKLDRKPSVNRLNVTLQRSLLTHSGINLRFKQNAWYTSPILPECEIKDVDTGDIHEYKPSWLDFRLNTVALNVLHLLQNDAWYLCFDFFHGAVDGRSGLQFLYDFFALINGQKTQENDFSLIDYDIVKENNGQENKLRIPVWPSCEPIGWSPKKEGEARTVVVKTDTCTKSMAAKLSSAVAKCFTSKHANVIIPIDIRDHIGEKGKAFFGNLIAPIFVDARSGRKVDDLRREIVEYLKKKTMMSSSTANLFSYNRIPVRLRKAVLKILLPLVMSCKKFICCALVSPIGVVDADRLKSPYFSVEDVTVTFISFPFAAFTLTSLQYAGHTNTTVAWHSGRVSDAVATTLIDNIEDTLYT